MKSVPPTHNFAPYDYENSHADALSREIDNTIRQKGRQRAAAPKVMQDLAASWWIDLPQSCRTAALFRREAVSRYYDIAEVEEGNALIQTCAEMGCDLLHLLNWIVILNELPQDVSENGQLLALVPKSWASREHKK